MKKVLIFIALSFQLTTQFSQCVNFCNQNVGVFTNNDPSSIGYDNMVSSFHSSVVSEELGFRIWGEYVLNSGTGNALSPQYINSTNYPALTGSVYFVGLGSYSIYDVQLIVLTSTGLFASGQPGAVLSTSIKSTSTFAKITVNGKTDGLPTGITPDSVKMMFVSYETIIITTCGGRVFVLSQNANVRGGNGAGSATQWTQVVMANGQPLTGIVATRGNAYFAFALRNDNTLWTWGEGVYLGNSSARTNLNAANQMTLPSGITKIRMIQGTSTSGTYQSYYVLDTSNTLYSLGYNFYGQLSDNTTTERLVWVNSKYVGGSNITDARWISANEHDLIYPNIGVINSSSQVRTAGYNSTFMIGRTTNNGVNYLDYPTGITSTDTIFFCEVGGHTSAFVKKNVPRYGYTGHRANGSLGDGTTTNSTISTTNFTIPPVVNICGTICDTPSIQKLPFNCNDSIAKFIIKGRRNNKVIFNINGIVDSVIIGFNDTAHKWIYNPSSDLAITVTQVRSTYCNVSLTIKDTLRLSTRKDSLLSICRGKTISFNGLNIVSSGIYKDTLVNSLGCDSFITLNIIVKDTSSKNIYDTTCSNQVIFFNGQNLKSTGIYRDTLTNAQGCDSFIYLNLLVKDTSTKIIYDTICKNQTRIFNNQTLNTTGIYKDTLTNAQGCDSFLYLNLFVKDTSSKNIYDTICSNQSKLFNGINCTTTGIYKDTLTNAQGCDSFLYLNLFVKPISNYSFNHTICSNQSYTFNGIARTTTGTYFDTLVNVQGCDSFLTLNLTVNPTKSSSFNAAICQGQFYTWNGMNRTTSGAYLDTLVNANNCDSFLTLNLTVKDTSSKMIYDTICKNQTKTFNNQSLNTTGIYKDTLTNAQGCDSFLYLSLTVKDTSSKQIYDTICSNQSKLFNGINRTTTGIYKDTLTNAQGCDSFLYLNLFVKSISNYSFNHTICSNQSYTFNNQNLNSSGTYFDTLVNVQGCDSFLTLNLTVNPTKSSSFNAAICQGQFYTWNGMNRTTSGAYLDTFATSLGCDSVVTLNLLVKDTSTKTLYDTICKNQTKTFNNQTLNTTGIYKDTLTNAQGCDSFLYLNLFVKDTSSKNIYDTICSNQSKLFNGINRTTTGIYKDTLTNAQGCDSFLYLNLFVKPISNYSFSASICNNNPYNFNGQNLTTAGTYFDTLTNAQGCDSFLTLNLSVSTTSSHTLNVTICQGQVYNFNGQNRTTTGTYLDTLVNANNCDSFLTLNLAVKDTSTKMIYDTICKNQTKTFNNQTLSTSGIYKDTLTNAQGCDSFLYLSLTVKDTSSKQIYDTICSNQSKLFNGINRTTTGIYKDTLTNAQGCDSFLYLNLFVKSISNYSFNHTICSNQSYTFNNQNLNSSGTYFDTLVNVQGCDSFLTLNLTVNPTKSSSFNAAICQGQFYTWNGMNRTTSGAYLDTFATSLGCDSVVTLNLLVKDTSTKTLYDTICKNQTKTFNNQTLNTTGIYKDTLTNAQGCDSFLYLNLFVKDTSSKNIYDTICSNQSKLFNGINRTTTGIYKDTLTNAQGCDSFLYLNLFVKPISNYSFSASICNNNPYNFNGQNLTTAGTYFDTLTNAQGCDSFLTLNLSVSTTSSHTLNVTICQGQVYNFNGQNRTTTGTYLDTLVNANNCDSFLTLNLAVKDTSTKMIYDTICKNQTKTFNNQTLSTSGIYKDTLTNAQGCDSFLYLSLTVKDTSSKQIYDTICSNQSKLFNGINRTTTGIYKDTLTNAQGCDSFLYLNLFVKSISNYSFNHTICSNQSYTFNNQNLNSSGTYFDTLVNVQGCDSFLTLNLTVNPTKSSSFNAAICQGQFYTWNGMNRTTSGAYLDTFATSLGCDSVVTLNLLVKDTSTKTLYDTICKNQTKTFNNQTLNTTGIYKDTLTNAQGCDSFLYLSLTVKDTSSKNIYDTICSNYPLVFNGQSLNTTGHYLDTFISANGCDSILHLYLYVIPTTSSSRTVQICEDSFYTFKGQNLSQSGIYIDTLKNIRGCDSFVTLQLIVNPLPIANAGVDRTRINCDGDSVSLGNSSVVGHSYLWTPSAGLDNFNIASPWCKVATPTTYIVKVINTTTNCRNWDTVNINVTNSILTGNKAVKNLTCYSDASGILWINAQNGYPPYQYKVGGGAWKDSSKMTGLSAVTNNDYTIRDSKGCLFNSTYTLTQPPALSLQTILEKNLLCYNDSTGTIEVSISGGTSPYQYTWSRSNSLTNRANKLAAGVHTLIVQDDSFCTISRTYNLKEPDSISLLYSNIKTNPCAGDSLGEIKVEAAGGTSPYRYLWNNGLITNFISKLGKGIYTVSIEDFYKCTDTFVFSLSDPLKLQMDTVWSTDLNCEGRGKINIAAQGGIKDYLYSIDSGSRYSKDSSFDISKGGNYPIVVRDKNGCLTRDSLFVKNQTRIVVEVIPAEKTIQLTESIQLSFRVTEGDSNNIQGILWKPSAGLSCIDCPNPIATPYVSQIYELEILYADECLSKNNSHIKVISNDELYIPNSFAPNASDIENQTFRIYSNHILRSNMIIFNRWGEKVFETDQPHIIGWDGTYKQQPAPTAVYIYSIEVTYIDGRKIERKGEVTLVR